PIGINYAASCDDTLYVLDNVDCGNVTGTAFVEQTTDTGDCASLFDVGVVQSRTENYIWQIEEFERGVDTECDYTLTIDDPLDTARAMITFMTKSGKVVRKVYEYIPEQVAADPELVDFGLLQAGESNCKDLTLSNPIEQPVTIKGVHLVDDRPEFTLDTAGLFPITLQQDESITFEICATATEVTQQAVTDIVVAELSCFDVEVADLRFVTGDIICYITDADWGSIPVGAERPKQVTIESRGSVDVELSSIDWDDKVHFTRVENLNFPLTVKSGQPHVFTVYYKPTEEGTQDYTRAVFTGNTEVEKLYSDWRGTGILAGPVIEGYDWQVRRVLDQFATVDPNEGYPATIKIGRVGNADLQISSVQILNNDDGVFEIARVNQIPDVITGDDMIEIDAYFKPKEEILYERDIVINAIFNGESKSATAKLRGIGTLPHVAVTGYTFGNNLVGASETGQGSLEGVKTTEYPMDLTVFDVEITGADANAFRIDPDWLAAKPYNWTVTPEELVDIPIIFTAQRVGRHSAFLVPDDDASLEDPQAELVGFGFTEGLATTDHDFGAIYRTLSGDGQVTLTNTGSETVQITEAIEISGANMDNFQVLGYSTSDGQNNPDVPFDLPSNGVVTVDVRFTPDALGAFNAEIVYTTDVGEAVSNLEGTGKEYKIIASIPKDKYRTFPGGQQRIEFMLRRHGDENKDVTDANIQRVRAKVHFKQADIPNDLMVVYPKAEVPGDIYTAGTIMSDWDILGDYPTIVDNEYLEVEFGNEQAMNAFGTLFEFDMLTYLSADSKVPLPCEFAALDANGDSLEYVVITTEPGDIEIDPVCVQDLRLIVTTATQYSLHEPVPNPVNDVTTLKYSVGIKANTTITLYNSFGEKITDIINTYQTPGMYEVDLDISRLEIASGTYYIRLRQGAYEDVVPLVIVK
ncbi:MAG: choice-of-anchor D domain-containing protein, partial [Candidatus Kapaibacterium sp.]